MKPTAFALAAFIATLPAAAQQKGVFVTSAGDVGINTAEPSATLSLSGPSRLLTGTAIIRKASSTVEGLNTLFSKEVRPGDRILLSGQQRTIVRIDTDTLLWVNEAFGTDGRGPATVYPRLVQFQPAGGVPDEAITIAGSGAIGLGTPSPRARLHIFSSQKPSLLIESAILGDSASLGLKSFGAAAPLWEWRARNADLALMVNGKEMLSAHPLSGITIYDEETPRLRLENRAASFSFSLNPPEKAGTVRLSISPRVAGEEDLLRIGTDGVTSIRSAGKDVLTVSSASLRTVSAKAVSIAAGSDPAATKVDLDPTSAVISVNGLPSLSIDKVGATTVAFLKIYAPYKHRHTSKWNWLVWDANNKEVYGADLTALYDSSGTEATPLTINSAALLALQPKRFDATRIGYLARDVDAAGLKELVLYDDEGRPAGVNYPYLAVVLAQVVKAQAADLEQLKKENRAIREALCSIQASLPICAR